MNSETKYALVDSTGSVRAVIMANSDHIEKSGRVAAAGLGFSSATWVLIPAGASVGIGDGYAGATFTAGAGVPVPDKITVLRPNRR